MNIGIDIDGVLTNDDDCLMDTITKYIFENNLEGLKTNMLLIQTKAKEQFSLCLLCCHSF